MTGTAQTEATGFRDIYRLGVVTIPTHKPTVRRDKADAVYKNRTGPSSQAVIGDVAERHGGPAGVDRDRERRKSNTCPGSSRAAFHAVLNAKHHEGGGHHRRGRSARCGHQSPPKWPVSGTDVMLGGNVDFLVDKRLP